MFGETALSYVKIWNHPIETTIYKWLFEVPGTGVFLFGEPTIRSERISLVEFVGLES